MIDSLAMKGKRIIIPAELQQVLEQLYSSHVGLEKGSIKRIHILDKYDCRYRKH